MGKKLSAANIFDTLEVDLWGNNYTLRTITKSVSAKVGDVEKRVAAMDDADMDTDGMAHAMIELIDQLLKPSNGDRPAGELLTELWDTDELGMDWLTAFSQSLQEESQARRRPTSLSRKNA